VPEGAVVFQGWDLAPRFGDLVEVDGRCHDADILASIRQDLAPGIDDQGMAPGLAAFCMGAALIGRQHEAAGLDRPGTGQHVPMCLAVAWVKAAGTVSMPAPACAKAR